MPPSRPRISPQTILRSEVVPGNSEILYFFEGTNCNPNGDSYGGAPRVDPRTGTCYVSASRIKRTVRDYWLGRGIPVLIPDLEIHRDGYIDALTTLEELQETKLSAIKEKILASFIDARLFGFANVFTGGHLEVHGPVQLTFARSLFPVQSFRLQGTAAFASKKNKRNRSFRDDQLIFFGMFQGYGIISGRALEETRVQPEDLQALDEAVTRGINQLHSRTKIGHRSRLYIRVEFKEDQGIVGIQNLDEVLVKYSAQIAPEQIRQCEELDLEVSGLVDALTRASKQVARVHLHDGNPPSLQGHLRSHLEDGGLEVRAF